MNTRKHVTNFSMDVYPKNAPVAISFAGVWVHRVTDQGEHTCNRYNSLTMPSLIRATRLLRHLGREVTPTEAPAPAEPIAGQAGLELDAPADPARGQGGVACNSTYTGKRAL